MIRLAPLLIPPNLTYLAWKKNTMTDVVIKCLKHINDVSNSNIVRNADGLLATKEVEVPVDWVGEKKKTCSTTEIIISKKLKFANLFNFSTVSKKIL